MIRGLFFLGTSGTPFCAYNLAICTEMCPRKWANYSEKTMAWFFSLTLNNLFKQVFFFEVGGEEGHHVSTVLRGCSDSLLRNHSQWYSRNQCQCQRTNPRPATCRVGAPAHWAIFNFSQEASNFSQEASPLKFEFPSNDYFSKQWNQPTLLQKHQNPNTHPCFLYLVKTYRERRMGPKWRRHLSNRRVRPQQVLCR